MEDLLDPVIDKLISHKDQINMVKQEVFKSSRKVDELRDMFLNTSGKLDVFEQINIKIAQAEAEVKILEDKFLFENKNLNRRMEDVTKTAELQSKVFGDLK